MLASISARLQRGSPGEGSGVDGVWTYIIIQTVIIIIWMTMNVVGFIYHFDEYPFILLNLGLSAQASYAAPLILMAANRSAQADRLTLEHDTTETDSILALQQTQLSLLNAIKVALLAARFRWR